MCLYIGDPLKKENPITSSACVFQDSPEMPGNEMKCFICCWRNEAMERGSSILFKQKT